MERKPRKSQEAVQGRLIEFAASNNVAELLDEDTLNKLGDEVIRGYEIDKSSRQEWEEDIADAKKIAKQVIEAKNTPWEGAANVKMPLIANAVIQFNARTYPQIIQGDKVVKTKFAGNDPTGAKMQAAENVAMHMNYQNTGPGSAWERDTDNLLMMLPFYGIMFRKSYWNSIERRYEARLAHPDYIVVNYNASWDDNIRRISHEFNLTRSEIEVKIRNGLYMDGDYKESNESNPEQGEYVDSWDIEHKFIEQHCWKDLDEDGLEEPYIITVHLATRKVAAIATRFEPDEVEFNDAGQVSYIKAQEYFTPYYFMPAPDGNFYGLGFGRLLYAINESINTLVNQLLDAGTLSNSQSGFIGKGFNIRNGDIRFRPGEWKQVDSYGADISKNIVPLPIKEPSNVLFSLLGLLIEHGKGLSSVTEMLQGQQPAQNVPATTAMALIEQGLIVFNGIQKRIYRSLSSEFQKQFELNKKHFEEEMDFITLSGEGSIKPEDYQNDRLLVYPVADPNIASSAQKMMQINALMQIKGDPAVNSREITIRYLQSLQVPDLEKLILPPPDPNAPPPPEVQKIMAETKLLNSKADDVEYRHELKAIQLHINDKQADVSAEEARARIDKMHVDSVANLAKVQQADHHKAIDSAIQSAQKAEQLLKKESTEDEPNAVNVDQKIAELLQPPQQPQPPAPPGAAPEAGGPGPSVPPEMLPPQEPTLTNPL